MGDWQPSRTYNSLINGHHRVAESRAIYGINVSLSTSATGPDSISIPYSEFVERVCVYRTSDVLRALSVQSGELFAPDAKREHWRIINPWAAAAIAKESLLHGSEEPDQRDLSAEQIFDLFSDFGHAHDPEPDDQHAVARILATMFYEQFGWQESIFEELARAAALFRGGSTRDHEFIRQIIEDALGVSIEDAIAATFVISGGSKNQNGRWRPELLDDENIRELFDIVPKEAVLKYAAFLTADRGKFEESHTRAMSRVPNADVSKPQRHGFNPLFKHPIVEISPNEMVVPIDSLVARRLSPAMLYYDAIALADQDFTSPLGRVVEDYAGRQLKELESSGSRVISKFRHRAKKEEFESTDWFVDLPDCVLFVEVKSARVLLAERMGQMPEDRGVRSLLTEAFNQINKDVNLFIAKKSEFVAHIPSGKPMLGLVVTSEPIYHGNSPFIRELLPAPKIPITVIPMRVLERIVMMDSRLLGAALLSVLHDSEKSTWPLITALGNMEGVPLNRILQNAADELPIFRWKPTQA